jgi:hypothetical protein
VTPARSTLPFKPRFHQPFLRPITATRPARWSKLRRPPPRRSSHRQLGCPILKMESLIWCASAPPLTRSGDRRRVKGANLPPDDRQCPTAYLSQGDCATCFRIAGICGRRIPRKASTVGLWDPRGQIAQRHKALERTVKGRRTVFCWSKPRAQLGTNETPRPHSTSRKTVVIKSVSCRILGEKPAWRHIPTASSNTTGAPTR